MAISDGISDQRRAYLTGVTCSCGSRSTCMCSIIRQKDARRSKGRSSSDMQRRIRSTSSWPEILLMAKYCRSKHILANRFNWYLWSGHRHHWQASTSWHKKPGAVCVPVVADHILVLLLTFFSILGQLSYTFTPYLFVAVLPEQPDFLLIFLRLHRIFPQRRSFDLKPGEDQSVDKGLVKKDKSSANNPVFVIMDMKLLITLSSLYMQYRLCYAWIFFIIYFMFTKSNCIHCRLQYLIYSEFTVQNNQVREEMNKDDLINTHFVSMRMSPLVGSRTALQMSSCVTGMDLFIDTHRSER